MRQGPMGAKRKELPILMSWSAGARSWQGSPPRFFPGLTIQDPKGEVLLPVTELARASGNLGTYLASFPSCHTVLHFHGFNHTNFLTFCYLEKWIEKRQVLKAFWFCNNTQGWSHQEILCQMLCNLTQTTATTSNTSCSKWVFGGQQRRASSSVFIKCHRDVAKMECFPLMWNVQIWRISADGKICGFWRLGIRGK